MKVISLLDEEAIIDALKSYIYSALNNNWDTKEEDVDWIVERVDNYTEHQAICTLKTEADALINNILLELEANNVQN